MGSLKLTRLVYNNCETGTQALWSSPMEEHSIYILGLSLGRAKDYIRGDLLKRFVTFGQRCRLDDDDGGGGGY